MGDPISRFIAQRASKPFGAPQAKGLQIAKPAAKQVGKRPVPPPRAADAPNRGVGPTLPTPAAVTKGSKGVKKAKGRKGSAVPSVTAPTTTSPSTPTGNTTHIHIHLNGPQNGYNP